MTRRPDYPNHIVAQVDTHVTDNYDEGVIAVTSIGRARRIEYSV